MRKEHQQTPAAAATVTATAEAPRRDCNRAAAGVASRGARLLGHQDAVNGVDGHPVQNERAQGGGPRPGAALHGDGAVDGGDEERGWRAGAAVGGHAHAGGVDVAEVKVVLP